MSQAPAPGGGPVVAVPAAETRPLRARVLRSGLPLEASVYPGDDDFDSVHLAVREAGAVVAVASLYREPVPEGEPPARLSAAEAGAAGWRLRGMASLPEVRGRGHGRALLAACVDHVRGRGGGILWCNAREPAVGFYRRGGLEVRSERFDIPGIGPHYRMLTAVDPERKAPEHMSERTLVLVKPDGVRRGLIGEVVGRIERKGLRVSRLDMRTIARDLAEQHYAEHVDKPFYAGLVDFITSGPLVAMVVEGEGAVAAVRGLMGATNPLEAVPGSIRGDYAVEIGENIVHGSDSPENGDREVKLFFPDA